MCKNLQKLINCRDLLNVHLDSLGKHQMESLAKKKEFILLGDLNCDLLSEPISKSKHLVHIYNTWSYAGYKGSNQNYS